MSESLRLWLGCAGASLAVTVATFWGVGGLVHYCFYVRRRARAAEWKLQPGRWLGRDLTRHAFALGSVSILIGSLVGATFTWYVLRGGRTSLYFHLGDHSLAYVPLSALLVFFAIDAGLYYSHRLLHNKYVFKYLHRWHHRYVAPIVFTTTASHPVEFLIFQFFLILPAFIIPVHVAVYIALILYTYLIGMIDHTGIRTNWSLPLHASNSFHDDHHVYFHCNYGHHTALFDRLHGTIRRAGRRYDETTFGGRGAPL